MSQNLDPTDSVGNRTLTFCGLAKRASAIEVCAVIPGIRDLKTASQIYTAGADIIVIGNKVEENRHFISEMAQLKSELFSKI